MAVAEFGSITGYENFGDRPREHVCTKFGQNPLKDVDSSVHKDVMW